MGNGMHVFHHLMKSFPRYHPATYNSRYAQEEDEPSITMGHGGDQCTYHQLRTSRDVDHPVRTLREVKTDTVFSSSELETDVVRLIIDAAWPYNVLHVFMGKKTSGQCRCVQDVDNWLTKVMSTPPVRW